MTIVLVERKTRDEYIAPQIARAEKCFKDHVIRNRDSRSWLAMKPYRDERGGWDSCFWFEAIVLAGGELYVHGDISGVHFAHYGKYQNPETVLRWMGGREFEDYVEEKAGIGMQTGRTDSGCILIARDSEVWLDEALSYVEDNLYDKIQGDPKGAMGKTEEEMRASLTKYKKHIPEWLATMIEKVLDGGDIAQLQADPHHDMDGDDWGSAWDSGAMEWGEVPSTRIIYAHTALRRLVALLDAEHAAVDAAREERVGDGG